MKHKIYLSREEYQVLTNIRAYDEDLMLDMPNVEHWIEYASGKRVVVLNMTQGEYKDFMYCFGIIIDELEHGMHEDKANRYWNSYLAGREIHAEICNFAKVFEEKWEKAQS